MSTTTHPTDPAVTTDEDADRRLREAVAFAELVARASTEAERRRAPEPRYQQAGQNRTEHDGVSLMRRFPKAVSVTASCPKCGFIDFVDLDPEGRLLRGDRRFRRIYRPAVLDNRGHIEQPDWVVVLHARCGTRVRFAR